MEFNLHHAIEQVLHSSNKITCHATPMSVQSPFMSAFNHYRHNPRLRIARRFTFVDCGHARTNRGVEEHVAHNRALRCTAEVAKRIGAAVKHSLADGGCAHQMIQSASSCGLPRTQGRCLQRWWEVGGGFGFCF